MANQHEPIVRLKPLTPFPVDAELVRRQREAKAECDRRKLQPVGLNRAAR